MKKLTTSVIMLIFILSINSTKAQEFSCDNMRGADKFQCENLKKLLDDYAKQQREINKLIQQSKALMASCSKNKPLCDNGNTSACTFLKNNCAGVLKGYAQYK